MNDVTSNIIVHIWKNAEVKMSNIQSFKEFKPIRKSVKDGDHHQRYLCHQEYCYDYYQHQSGSLGVFLQMNFRYQRAPARFTGKLIRNDNGETIFTLQWSLCCCIESFVISEYSSLSSYCQASSLDSES